MNKQDKIKELEKTIEEAQAEIEALKRPKRWKPEYDEVYYYKGIWGAVSRRWHNNAVDNRHYRSGNCYRTKEEAQRAYDRDILLTEMWDDYDFDADWGDEDQDKFLLYYDYGSQKWSWLIYSYSRASYTFPIYKSIQDLDAAIKKYGERMTELFIKRVGDER